jgi:transcriptional regulator with XRE-family HTH domain
MPIAIIRSMDVTRPRWGRTERSLLRKARSVHGHTQTQCAAELMALGAPTAAQSTVANWESGKTRRPSDLTIGAIEVYCDGVIGEVDAIDEVPHRDLDREFNEMVTELTGTRPLTDRQARALDGLVTRLTAGPAMSEPDLEVALIVLRLSGLDARE